MLFSQGKKLSSLLIKVVLVLSNVLLNMNHHLLGFVKIRFSVVVSLQQIVLTILLLFKPVLGGLQFLPGCL